MGEGTRARKDTLTRTHLHRMWGERSELKRSKEVPYYGVMRSRDGVLENDRRERRCEGGRAASHGESASREAAGCSLTREERKSPLPSPFLSHTHNHMHAPLYAHRMREGKKVHREDSTSAKAQKERESALREAKQRDGGGQRSTSEDTGGKIEV